MRHAAAGQQGAPERISAHTLTRMWLLSAPTAFTPTTRNPALTHVTKLHIQMFGHV